jgi:hypothetical protein
MSNTLISALINKNALAIDTLITASYQGLDLFGRSFKKTGEFRIKNIITKKEFPVFELVSGDEIQNVIQADADSIYAIDGMDLIRYADIYDILPDGTSKKVGRKRGRKPKTVLNA